MLFPGGPGYDDALAMALQLNSISEFAWQNRVFRTYTFDKAKVVTTSTVGSRVETGVAELTYAAGSPASVFANQQFLGFYRDNAWTTCLGVPIWDYGSENKLFTATTAAPLAPVTVYDPTHAFLNGGSLPNVRAPSCARRRISTRGMSWSRCSRQRKPGGPRGALGSPSPPRRSTSP